MTVANTRNILTALTTNNNTSGINNLRLECGIFAVEPHPSSTMRCDVLSPGHTHTHNQKFVLTVGGCQHSNELEILRCRLEKIKFSFRNQILKFYHSITFTVGKMFRRTLMFHAFEPQNWVLLGCLVRAIECIHRLGPHICGLIAIERPLIITFFSFCSHVNFYGGNFHY